LSEMKICSKCGEEFLLTIEYFYRKKTSKDGYEGQCKKCIAKRNASYVKKPKRVFINDTKENYPSGTKECSICKRELPADENHFYLDSNYPGKFVSACKECRGYNFNKPKAITREGHKICSKCEIEKPLTSDYFSERPKGSIDGFRGECRTCETSRIREWTSRNRVVRREKQREWKYSDPKRKEKWDSYYSKNRDAIIARAKKWDTEHKERSLLRSHEWYENNKERSKANTVAWRKANPEKKALSHQKRRSLKKKLKSTLTIEQWEITLNHFNGKCAYCGEGPKDGDVLQRDHFQPLAKHGEYSAINVLPACKFCNSSKGKKIFSMWYPLFKHYSPKRERDILKYLNYRNGVQQLALI